MVLEVTLRQFLEFLTYSRGAQITGWRPNFCSVAPNTWCVQVLRSPKEAFSAAMQSWRERCEKCVCLHDDYVDK